MRPQPAPAPTHVPRWVPSALMVAALLVAGVGAALAWWVGPLAPSRARPQVAWQSLTLEARNPALVQQAVPVVLVSAADVLVRANVPTDLAAAALTVTLRADVAGRVTLLGRTVTVDGVVGGRLAVAGAQVVLGPNAVLPANAAVCALALDDRRANPTAVRGCDAAAIALSWWPLGATSARLLLSVCAALLPGLAVLGAAAFPRRANTLEGALRAFPARTAWAGAWLLLGLLGVVAAGGVLLAQTGAWGLLGLPVVVVAAVGAGMALAVGWLAQALALGAWLRRRLSARTQLPALDAALGGVLVATLMVAVAWTLGVGAALGVWLLLGVAGLGAVFLTRWGVRLIR